MGKKKKNSFVAGFKLYNYVMQEIWKLLTTILFGIVAGYLFNKYGEEGNHYFLITFLVCVVIGIINFFIGVIRIARKEEEKEKRRQEYAVSQANEGTEEQQD